MPAPSVLPGRANQRINRVSRLLFHWRAADLSLTPITGEAPTFVRATGGGMVADANGRLHDVAQYQPRFEMVDLDGDGVRETPGAVLEQQRTNRCLQSQDFGTAPWGLFSGTPTRVAAALVLGDLVLDLLGDDDAVVDETYFQDITVVGDGIKSFSFYVKAGTSQPAGGSLVKWRDTTVGDRLEATITWSAGVPSVTLGGVGTYLGSVALGSGAYRLLFETLAITAADINRLMVVPAKVPAETGTLYIGGVQAEDATFPSSYIKTTSAAATRNNDDTNYVIAFGQRDLTIWADAYVVEWLDRASVGADNIILCMLRDAAPNNYLALYRKAGMYEFLVSHKGAGSGAQNFAAALPAATRRLKVLVQYDHAGKTIRLDPGTGILGAAAAITDAHNANFTTLHLGGAQAASERATGLRVLALKVAAGLFTAAQMEEMF